MAQEVKPISKRKGILGALALVAVALGLYWSLAVAPPDAYQGEVQRIMYLHLPSILTAYLSYFLVFVGSGMYLWKREKRDDLLAHSAAEIGVLFTALTIIEGSIWGKPTWGVWWTWEPRLVTTAIMFVMYVGYLLLRGLSTDFSRRATRAAVFGIIAVIDVPIVHLSVLWANSLHQLPTVLRAGGSPALDSTMLLTLMVSLGAYTLIYAYFMTSRISLELARHRRLWTT